MKKRVLSFLFIITLFSLTAVSASAVVNDTLKVGIRWGDTALEAANLENAVGSGYEFGYYDEDREFVYLDETDETTITMQASGSGNGVTVTETRSVRSCSNSGTTATVSASAPWDGTRRPGARAISTPAALSTDPTPTAL